MRRSFSLRLGLYPLAFAIGCGTSGSSTWGPSGASGDDGGAMPTGDGPTGTDSGASGSSGGSSSGTGSSGSNGSGSSSGSGKSADGSAPAEAGAATGDSSVIKDAAMSIACTQAVNAYTVASISLDASMTPHTVPNAFGSSLFAQIPVAVDAATGNVYVGFTLDKGSGNPLSAVIVPGTNGASTPIVSVPNAALGGLAVTGNGYGVLEFDPNDNVDNRMWASVGRFDTTGTQLFTTDLFRSANLTDEGTDGAPDTSRFAYVPGSDQLVAYFGHTQMIQGTRHQGGYVATMSTAGAQSVVSDWWGSHNLDQRLLVTGSQVGLLGLGDAYPKGIFFAFMGNNPNTNVIYTLAGDGQGTTNGQLGGLVDLDDVLFTPFITNDSISQTLTPGDWPNIDQTIASQIDTAAANGNKLGFLLIPKTGSLGKSDLTPVWLDPMLASGAHLERLKSARYGSGSLVILAWSETSGTGRSVTRNYFTMIVDRTGAVCQPKTPLAATYALPGGDDFVRRSDGSIVWANVTSNRISVVTLTPG